MKVRAAQATTIVLFALVMGVFWGTWFSLSRTMSQLSAETFLAVGHEMIQNLGMPMAILLPLALLSALVTLALLWPRAATAAFWWLAAGLLLMVAALVDHPRRRGPDRQPDPGLDGGDPARRLALDPVTLGAVPHHPYLHLDRGPDRGHHQRHDRGASEPAGQERGRPRRPSGGRGMIDRTAGPTLLCPPANDDCAHDTLESSALALRPRVRPMLPGS